MPKISMLCPVYNGEKYLEQAIQSVLNQTYRDFEFILYDDGSTDGTAEILNHYAKMDPRIIVIHGDKNRGSLYARNELIKVCAGEFVVWIDADDWYDRDFLQDAVVIQQDGNYDMVLFGNVAHVDPDGEMRTQYTRYDSFIYIGNSLLEIAFPYLRPYRCSLWSRFIRASIMKSASIGIPGKRYAEDDIFYQASLFLSTKRFQYVDGKPYYYYRRGQGQWDGRRNEINLERLRSLCELCRDCLIHWFNCLKQHNKWTNSAIRVCYECCNIVHVADMVHNIPAEHRAEAEAIFFSYFCEDDRLPNKAGPQYPPYVNRLKFIMQYGLESIV